MLVRIRSKTGTARYEVSPNDDVSVLLNKILADTPNADPSSLTLSQQPRGGETSASELSGDVQGLGIKHGDLLFVAYEEAAADGDTEAAAAAVPAPAASHGARLNGAAVPAPELSDVASSILQGNASKTAVSAAGKSNKPWQHVVEDLVDTHWENADGKIYRKKDARMCKHGEKSMCDHCMPLEPYDAVYQEEHKIKHLSFHSYLRKRDITTNRSTGASSNTFIPPLSEPNYKVAVPCPSGSHPSWPAGICTKCQPSAVTLALQQYRMVDHVEFASPAIIESLLEFWRRTGSQRFGWLLGRYETYDIVPMGVKAVVEAIHEPPQEGELDGVRLGLPWEDESKVESLAQMCGLRVVGMIFTDLTPDTSSDEVKKQGKVLAKRHKDSYFLSSLEAIFAAKQAHRHANPSRFSDTGKFGSKFVTCVVTGDREGNVAVEAYQVSDQAMAMVEADMIEASVEPGVVRIREDTSEEKDTSNTNIKKRYIPDVFYTYKNQYNLQVKEVAKPCFPTDYLLVSLTNGFPTSANPLFVAAAATAFPIENRAGLHDQSIAKASVSLNKLVRALPDNMPESSGSKVKGKGKATDVEAFENLGKWLSDWHLLAYLDTVGIFDKSDVQLLAKVATTRDPASLVALLRTPSWQTFVTIAGEHAGSGSGGPGSALQDAHSFPTDADGFPIIPDDHDMMRTDTPRTGKSSFGNDADDFHSIPDVDNPPDGAGGGGEGAAGGGGGGVITCPHCTYENPAGSVDCEICSLPLQG